MMRNRARLGSAAGLLLLVQVARADNSTPPAAAAATPCKIGIDGGEELACLPAISADGTRIAVPERCDERAGRPCFAIAFLSPGGKVRERVEVAGNEARLARVNRLLAGGSFTRLPPLEVPFSARDLNVMHARAGDVAIHYGEGKFFLERHGSAIAKLELPEAGSCSGPWIRSLFLDQKTRTLAVEFEYYDRGSCSAPAPGWRVLRFP